MHELSAQVRRWLSEQPWGSHPPVLLDFGCGSAEYTRPVVEAVLPAEIYLVDSDIHSLEEARDELAAVPGAPEPLSAATLSDLDSALEGAFGAQPAGSPPMDGTPSASARALDLVLVSDVLHHLKRPADVLCELLGRLQERGLLVVREIVPASSPESPAGLMTRLHECKAAVDRVCGIPHGPLLSGRKQEAVLEAALASADHAGATASLADRDRETGVMLPPQAVADYLAAMDRYLEHAAGSPVYAGLRRELARVGEKAIRAGLAMPETAVYRLQRSA